ncbi:MAG: hypothetical protein KDA87_02055 [Planctomycetales bacterium]|nr:hypothetical protein [Planctomycetales bacterium]
MSDRPKVDAAILSEIIDGAPDRIRRRLDRDPGAANQWQWALANGDCVTVQAGNETVHLAFPVVTTLSQVKCSCLLSPHCFHIVACLTLLEIESTAGRNMDMDTDSVADSRDASPSVSSEESAVELVQPSIEQISAASELTHSLDQLLQTGVLGAGVVVQSNFLRAIHQCRSVGLYRAAALSLRLVTGVRQVRQRTPDADLDQLAKDLVETLQTVFRIANAPVESYWIGTARRRYFPVNPGRLHGLLAEPILTRSGFAGVAVYFLAEDSKIYSVSNVRPGDAQVCRHAYQGGIDFGGIVEPAKRMSRSQYLGAELTASIDGRLGQGSKIKVVRQGDSSWSEPAIANRFAIPLEEQIDRIDRLGSTPTDARPAGWDFVFLRAEVLGASGPELVIQPEASDSNLRLAVAIDSPDLEFRHNLEMLSHAPGMTVSFIGRMQPEDPAVVLALAMGVDARNHVESESDDCVPRLELNEDWLGRVNLGLDLMKRHRLLHGLLRAHVLDERQTDCWEDPLSPLRRRWIAMLLGGWIRQADANHQSVRHDVNLLQQSGFAAGAELLDALVRADADAKRYFWAVAEYLRTCSVEWRRHG